MVAISKDLNNENPCGQSPTTHAKTNSQALKKMTNAPAEERSKTYWQNSVFLIQNRSPSLLPSTPSRTTPAKGESQAIINEFRVFFFYCMFFFWVDEMIKYILRHSCTTKAQQQSSCHKFIKFAKLPLDRGRPYKLGKKNTRKRKSIALQI